MASVTDVVNTTKQPYGGFIKPSQFTTIQFKNEEELSPTENLSPATIGLVVDYMTRYMMGAELTKAFEISCMGVSCAKVLGYDEADTIAQELLKRIKGLDDESIASACKLVWFDVYYRNPLWGKEHKNQVGNDTDTETISNIRILINRSLSFWKRYGPIVKDGFTFEPVKKTASKLDGDYGGYTPTVNRGDGDYLSEDTLWDFKVSRKKLTSKITLQLLMYWIMGIHSGQPEFQKIKKLGVFNPRLNAAYIINTDDIPKEVIKTVEDNVIGYRKPQEKNNCALASAKEFLVGTKERKNTRYNIGDTVNHTIFGKGKVIKTRDFKNDQIVEINFTGAPAKTTASAGVRHYEVGDVVEHKVFGRGRVMAVKAAAGDQIVEINFEKVGVKKTMANFAPLTKITEE